MCGSCDANFVKYMWDVCTECPSYNTNLIWFMIRMFFTSLFILGICNLQANTTKTNIAFVNMLKIIVNHCVLMSAVSDIKYNWSNTVDSMIDYQREVVSYLSKFATFNCLINGTTETDPSLPNTSFYNSLLFSVTAPIYFIIWFSLLFILYTIFKGAPTNLREKWVCMVVVTLWCFHPDVCHMIFATFSCIDVDQTGVSRLFYDLEVACYQGDH